MEGAQSGGYGRRWQGAPTVGTFRLHTLNRASVGGDRRLYELVAGRDPFHVHRAECVRARPRRQPAAMEWSCMNKSKICEPWSAACGVSTAMPIGWSPMTTIVTLVYG